MKILMLQSYLTVFNDGRAYIAPALDVYNIKPLLSCSYYHDSLLLPSIILISHSDIEVFSVHAHVVVLR